MTAKELYDAVCASPPFPDDPRLPPTAVGCPQHFFARLVRHLRPRWVLELGTGDGATAAEIACAKHEFAFFVTINWPSPPSGDDPWRYLGPWRGSRMVQLVMGDTREQAHRFPDGVVDLLYIDSTHTRACAVAEWVQYRQKMTDGAAVVVDDINQNDMREFWDPLPYDKCEVFGGRSGLFLYERGREC